MKDNGLLQEENKISDLIVEIWDLFNKLEQTHPSDLDDVQNAIHQLQYVLGMRSLRRLYPNQWVSYNCKRGIPITVKDECKDIKIRT